MRPAPSLTSWYYLSDRALTNTALMGAPELAASRPSGTMCAARNQNHCGEEKEMNRVLSSAAAAFTALAAVAWASSLAEERKREIVAVTANEVRWSTPSYYKDGRQRAQLFGDSGQGGTWIDRVKIPGGARVLAHTHPQDELVTVIEGRWYLGEGT